MTRSEHLRRKAEQDRRREAQEKRLAAQQRREEREKRRLQREAEGRELAKGPIDLPFLLLVCLLLGIGLIMVFSASFPSAYYSVKIQDPFFYIKRQGMWAILGLCAMVLTAKIDYHRFKAFSKPALFVAIILLALVLVPGVGTTRNHATRWIEIGGLSMQPSEVAKFAVALYFADSISKKREKMRTFRYGILPYGIILVLIAGLMMFEPHLSGTVLILGTGAVMMVVGGIPGWLVGTGVGGGAILDGRPYREIRRPGSEFGHMITHAGGELCPCGERGCYERYASSAALVRRAPGYQNAREILDAVRAGEPAVLPIWESYIEEVCVGLISLMAIFFPDVISIGGGISAAGDFLLDAIRAGLNRHESYRKYYSGIRVCLAEFCNDAGVLGAAASARREMEKNPLSFKAE